MKRYMIETLILVLAATLCAVVANAMAGRERKLALVGSYGTSTRPAAAPVSTTPDWVATTESETTTSGVAADRFEPLPEPAAATDGTAGEPEPAPTATSPTKASIMPIAAKAPQAPPPAQVTKAQATAPAPPQRATREQILARFAPTPDLQYVEITGQDAAWLHNQGALFLDARRTSIYEQGHIAGARSFSVWESDIDDKVGALMEQTPDQKMPIVVYCSGGACEDSHMLSEKLWGVFFENVLVYKDGFPDWQQRGGAIRTGAQP